MFMFNLDQKKIKDVWIQGWYLWVLYYWNCYHERTIKYFYLKRISKKTEMNRFENKREKSFHDKLKLKLNFKAYPLIVFIKIRILILAFIVETKYMMDRNL